MSSRRYYSHRRNPVHRTILCGLFRLGPSGYRHRRESLNPLLRLFGIQPRRSEYTRNQYYAPERRAATTYASRSEPPRAARRTQSYYSPADQGAQGRQPMTIAERHAAQYRQRQTTAQGQGTPEYRQPAAPRQPSPAGYSQRPQQAVHGRTFHEHRPTHDGKVHSNLPLQAHGNQTFQQLPRPTGGPPYHMTLDSVLPPQEVDAIRRSGHLMLHVAGDTGGVKVPQSQQIVAMAMETHFNYPDATLRPAFFYHLGDVVYFFGEEKEYYPQFYDPYVHYPAPIFAIPGNHDGDVTDGSAPSLTAFVNNFCTTEPRISVGAGETGRTTMTQPNVYWTLEAPFLTVIGLYSNVPEGGRIDPEQLQWFVNELRTAPPNQALFVAAHHPALSADTNHSGSSYMLRTLDSAFQQAGRWPDAIFAGHVHNYQRFTRDLNGRHIPYIIAGSGGYWHLHYVAKGPDGNKLPVPYKMEDAEVTLENYCDDHHGFMRLMVTPTQVIGQAFACPRPQESWRADSEVIDAFTLDLRSHKLIKGTNLR